MSSKRESFCSWSNSHDIYMKYHDNEWGQPEFNGRKLFEMLTLETFQSGLSWIIILKKRNNFKIALKYVQRNIKRTKKTKIACKFHAKSMSGR